MAQEVERMVTLQRAFELIDVMKEKFYEQLGSEYTDAAHSTGRRLAEDVIARTASPPYDICTMDGYALATGDQYPLRVITRTFAGEKQASIKPGEAAYVTTGTKLPEGANAVMRVEDAKIDGDQITGPRLEPGTFVLPAGADFQTGETLINAGTVISPSMVGVLEAASSPSARVYQKISVAVITTGDEIANGEIKDTNGPMICALLRSWGCKPHYIHAIRDDRDLVREAIKTAAYQFDIVITVGGVSAGAKDYVKSVAEEGEIVFSGVRVKPGMPFTASYYNGTPLLSLPGKPAGSYTGMELFVKRLVYEVKPGRTVTMPLCNDVTFNGSGFEYLVFVELIDGCARPMGYRSSSLGLFDGTDYVTSLISATSRSLLSDGYFLAKENLSAGQIVSVNLM